MKRLHGFLFAILVFTTIAGNAYAAHPQEKFGNGKLLRQFRDDLFGKPNEKKPHPPAAQNQRQQPTPAQSPSHPGVTANQPQPPAHLRNVQPQMSQRANQSNSQKTNQKQQQYAARQTSQPNRNQPTVSRSGNPQSLPQPINRDTPRPTGTNAAKFASHRIPAPALNSAAADVGANREPRAVGMGMEIQVDKNERFMVIQVDPQGNAAKAGVQRGDMVVKIGGSDLKTQEELTEIIKVLGEGDQMEFQISRRGQIKDVMVQFGEAQIIPAGQEPVADPVSSPSPEFRQNSVEQPTTGRYDFVPQPANLEDQSEPRLQPTGTRSNPTSQYSQPIVDPSLSPNTNQIISQQRETLSELELELDPAETTLLETAPQVEFGPSILELPELDGPGK